MIYNKHSNYKVKFYKNIQTNGSPALEYIETLRDKEKSKILKYIEFLRGNDGYLDEPYSRHIEGKIRELRVDFSHNRYRIFYFIFIRVRDTNQSQFSGANSGKIRGTRSDAMLQHRERRATKKIA